MDNVVIVAASRTAMGRAIKGGLAASRPDEFAAEVAKDLLKKVAPAVKPGDLEDVLTGCAMPEGEQGLNVSRLISFLAGIPNHVAATTINRFCGSSMSTIHYAAQGLMTGYGDIFMALGVESMTKVPMGGFNPLPSKKLYEMMPEAYISMGITAENLALKYNISRKEQDEFAVASHLKAADAIKNGRFKKEIVGYKTIDLNGNEIFFDTDDNVRANSSIEGLAKLRPVFDKNGTVTAGSSSPLTDGAAGVIMMTENKAKELGLTPLARIKSMGVAGVAPELMGLGPVPSTKKALKRAGMTLADIDYIELNEAFSAQSISVIKELEIDTTKLNMNGGAIALGHPLGASGARIITTLINVLEQKGGTTGLATMCIGGGQGIATIIERI